MYLKGMEPYDIAILADDENYYCFPCGILKVQNEPKPLFNKQFDNPRHEGFGKVRIELAYQENNPKCALCKNYI